MKLSHLIFFLNFLVLSYSVVDIFLASEFKDGPAEWSIENAKKSAIQCPFPCRITTSPSQSDSILYDCRDLPSLQLKIDPNKEKLTSVYCREEFQQYYLALDGADLLVADDLLETAQVVPVSSLTNIGQFLKDAKQAFSEKKTSMDLGFVEDTMDAFREQMAQDLSKFFPVKSYGKILNNTPWPRGYEKDKHYALKQHKFCLALEGSDRGATTERLWDCLRAASVPIYYGNLDLVGHSSIPTNSVIRLKSYPNFHTLGEFLWELVKNETHYEEYRKWIQEPNAEFIDFHRVRSPQTQVCRLCIKVGTNPMFQNPYL